jgi:hypothetical protein
MIRYFNKFKNIYDFSKNRSSSYPFISGDTFRAFADYCITSNRTLAEFSQLNIIDKKIIFIEIGFLNDLNNLRNIIKILDLFKIKNSVVILHNGDKLPDPIFFEFLKRKFKKIYCVNYVGNDNFIEAIPIGLENLHYWKNGVISNYNKLNRCHLRDIYIYSSFRVNTNYSERLRVKKICNSSRHIFFGGNISTKKNINNLNRSFFVTSPPGNGFDCHRTWEAIYCGAVPVVKEGTLSIELIKKLPILEVSDWRQLFNLDNNNLIELYNKIRLIPDCSAYFPYWNYKILKELNDD